MRYKFGSVCLYKTFLKIVRFDEIIEALSLSIGKEEYREWTLPPQPQIKRLGSKRRGDQ